MAEERRYEGYWWLPDEPRNKVGGVLIYTPTDGVELRLFSALNDDRKKAESDDPVEFSTVFGRTGENEKITVKNTIRTNWHTVNFADDTVMTAKHKSTLMYHGDHFTSDPQFNELEIYYPLLHGWFGKSGRESEIEEEDDSGRPIFIKKYQLPETVTVDLDEFELRLQPKTTHHTEAKGSQREEDTTFQVELDEGTFSLDDSREIARRLQAFLTLACGEETHFEKLVGKLYSTDEGLPPVNEVEILYSRSNYKYVSSNFDINLYTFDFSDVEEDFTSLMQDWFGKFDDLESVFSLYFATQYNSNLYVQNEFLSLTRAIESYHRIEHDGLYLPPDEYNDYYKDLVESIPNEYSEGFTAHLRDGTFKYANEYSLRKRLGLISEMFKDIFSILPINISSKINPIVNARNDLTHRDTESTAPDPRDLMHYSDILRVLIEIILLSEINIPDEKIKERVVIRHRYRLDRD